MLIAVSWSSHALPAVSRPATAQRAPLERCTLGRRVAASARDEGTTRGPIVMSGGSTGDSREHPRQRSVLLLELLRREPHLVLVFALMLEID